MTINQAQTLKIEIDNKHIEKVEITKFLLIILIDNNLSLKAHTKHIAKMFSKYNDVIRKVPPFLNKDSLYRLHTTKNISPSPTLQIGGV